MNPVNSGWPKDQRTLSFEIKGKFTDKTQIAATFRTAYQVLDRLCEAEVTGLNLIYHPDFSVEENLLQLFDHAAREALAYKDALSFGRKKQTAVVGLETISDTLTRDMAMRLHRGK